MSKKRKNYSPEEKVGILKRHLVEKVPISDLCDELGLHPTVFYRWQTQFNGPQFIAKDFKEFIRISGMSHVRTRPFYPQSNGKIERWHGVLKRECLRPKVPLSLEDTRRIVGKFVDDYNNVRLQCHWVCDPKAEIGRPGTADFC